MKNRRPTRRSWTLRLVLAVLIFAPNVTVSTFTAKGHDALQDDTDDAADYAKYMAATEASAPLMRRSELSPHHQSSQVKSIYRSVGGQVALLHPSADPNRTRRLVHAWSPWSVWSPCSRTCGGGITSRHRTCRTEYARVSEGSGIRSSHQQCVGESSEYSSCNPQSCSTAAAGHPEDFRMFQCSLYNNRTVRGHLIASWTPYQLGSNQCELTCRAGNKPNGLVYSFGKVLDGTRCTVDPENPYKEFCINGRCLAVGCDGRVGSPAKWDMCNVCGGNNSTCQRVAAVAFPSSSSSSGIFKKSISHQRSDRMTETYGYSPVVRIPRGATHVRLTDNSTNYLALMDESERYFLNGNWMVDWPGRYETSGVAFHYERIKDSEIVRSRGPLQQDLIVMVLQREKDPAIYYEYWLPSRQIASAMDRLKIDDFVSDAQHVVSARPTMAPAKAATPVTSRPIRRVQTPKTVKPNPPTSTSTVLPPRKNPNFFNSSMDHVDNKREEMYEPQPTAASLIRSPPRVTYGHFLAPFFSWTTQSTTTTTTTTAQPITTTTAKKSSKKSQSNRSKNKSNNIDQVRHHLGIVHKKNQKTVRSGGGGHRPSSCSIDGSCWKTVNGKKHFCLSEFVVRCKVLNYEVINGETRYEVQIVQSYKNMIPILSREFIWAEPVADCPCPAPYLRTGTDYIIMGKTDRKFRRNEVRLLLDADSYVRVYNQANAERVLRIRRDEAKFCQQYKTKFNLTF